MSQQRKRQLMWAAALALLLQAGALPPSDTNEAENWGCAAPLVEKNYQQPVKAEALALRIADECTRPHKVMPIASPGDETMEGQRRNLYSLQVQIFTKEIEAQIAKARRADAITLKR